MPLNVEIITAEDKTADVYEIGKGESGRYNRVEFRADGLDPKTKIAAWGDATIGVKSRVREKHGDKEWTTWKWTTAKSLEGRIIPEDGLRLLPRESVSFPVKTGYKCSFFSIGWKMTDHFYFWQHEKIVRLTEGGEDTKDR